MPSGYEKSKDYGGSEPNTLEVVGLAVLLAVLVAIFVAWLARPAEAVTTVVGNAVIVDGDTIDVDGLMVRLHGIDAPEVSQRCETARGREYRCGRDATDYLALAIEGRQVACAGDTFDDFDRLIAVCMHDGRDVSSMMAESGWAWAFVRFSNDYVEQEASARSQGLGVWRGAAQAPWEFRAARWEFAAQEAPEGCPIKGNISNNGQIYHAPWSPWYTRTQINTARGERWFCSEREALDAGWRAPYHR